MTDNEVTITKTEYRRLLECEEAARRRKSMCAGCGSIAQRDRIIGDLEKRITSELSGGVRELQHKLKLIRDLCGFRDVINRDRIIGDPYIFIDGILKRIVEIIEERN